MSRRKQSRKRQRQLEREMFGPEPKARRTRKRTVPAQTTEPRPTEPGSCWACGNRCWPANGPWTCPYCKVTYPVVDINSDGRVAR